MSEELALELKNLTVEELLTRYRAEVADHREREAEERRAAERKERVIEALEEALGVQRLFDPEEARNERLGRAIRMTKPEVRGIAAVRAAISTDPARTWKPREIHEIMVNNGWINEDAEHPLRGTEAAISRLVAKGELTRVGRGAYRLTGLGVIPQG